jgi:secondary thiamine-phosphate synthase enzyme
MWENKKSDELTTEEWKKIITELIPMNRDYEHSYEGNVNATSHIKNQMIGNSNLTIPVEGSRLSLGTWQQIFFLELLEPRRRKITITIMGE